MNAKGALRQRTIPTAKPKLAPGD